jgi:hypothetical protein
MLLGHSKDSEPQVMDDRHFEYFILHFFSTTSVLPHHSHDDCGELLDWQVVTRKPNY